MGKVFAAVAVVALIAGAFFFFNVDQTQEAALPDVDVTVEGGQMPAFDVDAGDVEVGQTTVTVPTLDIQSPEEDANEG